MTQPQESGGGQLVEEFRGRLRQMRQNLVRTAAMTDEELATLEVHQPGAPVEDVARETVVTILSRLGEREKHDLDEIYAAQARLETGTFGVCEGCRLAIPLVRLRAMPATRYCVTCQANEERRRP